jgi:hypothetical protein
VHGLDAPLAPGDVREDLGAGFLLAEAGDGVDDLLADQGAVGVVAVAADPGDALDLREANIAGVGGPDGAPGDAAMGAVQLRVIGDAAGAAGLDGVEGGALEGRGVPLDEQEVVGFPSAVLFLSRDVLRGLAAGMGGVGGDDRVLQVHVPEQFLHLGDPRGVVRDPDLPDDHLLVVQHRGEELDLAVQDAAQPLAVDRDRGQRLVQPARVRQGAEPPAGEVVQQVRADRLDEGADPGLAGGR